MIFLCKLVKKQISMTRFKKLVVLLSFIQQMFSDFGIRLHYVMPPVLNPRKFFLVPQSFRARRKDHMCYNDEPTQGEALL